MKDFLKFTIFQSDIRWNNKNQNLNIFSEALHKIPDTDIVIFPELFDTGFVTDVNILKKDENELSKSWLIKTAAMHNFYLGATSLYHENGKYYNRFFVASPHNKLFYYDKKHLFAIAGEADHISSGNKRTVINIDNWKLNLLVCYDLRFPVWARNKNDYDVLIYPANWPISRIAQWRALLIARAIENQAYTVGINRIGSDNHGFVYSGKSLIVNPKGEIIYEAKENKQDMYTATFDYNYLQKLRKNFPVLKDADDFLIT
ncbi:MAG: amidohydrolase [Bacteroidales bacterium]|nr:amidohydrolase [Bacteroidales bacterium]